MIKINLLDYRKERVRANMQMEIGAAILLVVLALGLAGFISSMQGKNIAGLTDQISAINKELANLKYVESKVAESEKMQKRLETMVKTISGLKENQKEPARLYHEILNRRLPTGEMWLDKLAEEPAGIVMEGYSFRDSAISAFMESLQKMEAFPEVVLEYVRQTEIEKRKVKKFKIICVGSKEGYSKRTWAGAIGGSGSAGGGKIPGGIYGMGGAVENALSREGAFQYGQQLSNELKQVPRNPFVEARNKARERQEAEEQKQAGKP